MSNVTSFYNGNLKFSSLDSGISEKERQAEQFIPELPRATGRADFSEVERVRTQTMLPGFEPQFWKVVLTKE
jgi:hypothetical protein